MKQMCAVSLCALPPITTLLAVTEETRGKEVGVGHGVKVERGRRPRARPQTFTCKQAHEHTNTPWTRLGLACQTAALMGCEDPKGSAAGEFLGIHLETPGGRVERRWKTCLAGTPGIPATGSQNLAKTKLPNTNGYYFKQKS